MEINEQEVFERRHDLPFGTDYAKSGRAACKKCKSPITKGSVRMSVREPSCFFDGLQDNWFHLRCFFDKIVRGRDEINEASIRGLENLKWDDQELIRREISEFYKKIPDRRGSLSGPTFAMIKVGYSATNRGKCKFCTKNFEQKQLKILWKSAAYHLDCFHSNFFITLGHFSMDIEDIGGFAELEDGDKVLLKQKLVQQVSPSKSDKENDPVDTSTSKEVKDELVKCDAGEITCMSEPSTSKIRNDCPIKQEPESNGPVSDYLPPNKRACTILERIRAKNNKTDEEKLKDELKRQTDWWWELREGFEKNLTRTEVIKLLEENDQAVAGSGNHDDTLAKMLDSLTDCALFGYPLQCPDCPKGRIVYSQSRRTYICLGYATAYSKCVYQSKNPSRHPFAIPQKMVEANPFLGTVRANRLPQRIYPPSEEVVQRSKTFKGLGARRSETAAESLVGQQKSQYGGKLGKLIIKNGTVVDAEFVHAEHCHVCKDDDDRPYNATLVSSDVVLNTNSYYKIQLLKRDTSQKYYVFRSWGRVGTVVGSTLFDEFTDIKNAVHAFETVFYEKTGNEWKHRRFFKKFPGRMDLIDTDFTEYTANCPDSVIPGSKTNLHRSVKELMLMIWNVDAMKSALQELDLDLNRMPLGKLSVKQIHNAYQVLTDLQNILSSSSVVDDRAITDATNRFYTLMPHNFGMRKAPMLNSVKMIKEKCEMLDQLLQIQYAVHAMNENREEMARSGLTRDPVDVNYEKLKCDLKYCSPESSDYKMVETYIKNSHGHTHNMYKISIIDVMAVDRFEEKNNFKKLHNRQLLWHGSRTSNFVGILSQGLRIAPPEAPVTGYMFGKGIYFADMVSKSANYCRMTGKESEGLLLLCDVALGDMKKEYQSVQNYNYQTVRKLGCHSVKGEGMCFPDPNGYVQNDKGYFIPLHGRIQLPQSANYTLLYNEFIVYDVSQVKIEYIVRCKFNPIARAR